MSIETLLESGFLEAVLPRKGYIFCATRKERMQHKHFTYDSWIEDIKNILDPSTLEKAKDVYFTPNSFKAAFTAESKTGRCTSNAAYSRSVFIDIDCGESKPYGSIEEALGAVKKFVQETDLPKPTATVFSGGGVHCYWVFNEDISIDKWRPVANGLKQLCIDKGLFIDPACTGDAARLMRLPGTLNKKRDPHVEVKVAFHHNRIYEFESFASKFETPPQALFGNVDDNEELESTGAERKASMALIVEKCPLLAEIEKTAGKWCQEPLWKATLQLAFYTENGREWAHKLSSGHEGYDAAQTDKKFDERDNSKPATCGQFREAAAGQGLDYCSDCPHNGKIKSPYSLGLQTAQQTAPTDISVALPIGWAFMADGVYKIIEGEKQRVIGTRIANLEVTDYDDVDGSPRTELRFNFWDSQKRTAVIHYEDFVDSRHLFTATASQRLSFVGTELKWFKALMESWVDTLRKSGKVKTSTSHRHMGWVFTEGKVNGFVLGDRCITPNNEQPIMGHSFRQLLDLYTPCGDISTWKEVASSFQGIIPHEVMLASAFAAPLMQIAGIPGAVLAVVSKESGVGKSSAMKVAQAVWGHPKKGINSLDDTEKSMYMKMGLTANLPMYWDEIRGKQPVQKFCRMAFRLTQGKDISRLNRNATMKNTLDWNTLFICASNTSVLDYLDEEDIDTNAGAMRVMEIRADGVKLDSMKITKVASDISKLDHCYGFVGKAYAKYLVQNYEAVAQAYNKLAEQIIQAHKCTQSERFWVATVTTLVLGAKLAKRLGFFDFDVPRLHETLIDCMLDMRHEDGRSAKNDFYDVIDRFLLDNGPTGIITTTMNFMGPPQDVEVMFMPRAEKAITHRYAENQKVVRIPRHIFKIWARSNGYNARDLIKRAIEAKAFLGESRSNLFAGTGRKGPRIFCYDFYTSEVHPVLGVKEKSKLNVPVHDSTLNNAKAAKK